MHSSREVSVEFKMPNERGLSADSFQEGEDIIYTLFMNNLGSERIIWYDWCEFFDGKSYATYKLNRFQGVHHKESFVGLPYSNNLACAAIPVILETGYGNYLKVSVSNSELVLIKVDYAVDFTTNLEIGDKVIQRRFYQEFTIH